MADIRIPDSLARRLDAFADARGIAPERIARDAIERQIDSDAWWKREVAKGISQADALKLVPAEQLMKRARRMLERHARRKASR